MVNVQELILELEKYDEKKKVRVLFGMPTPILWISHDMNNELRDGCVLVTSDEIELHEFDRIETVEELLWNLQFFNKEVAVWNNDLESCWSPICEVCDDVKDAEGNIIDTVFLINFAHMVG